jgi:ribose transport system substrate-binding protein
MSITRLLTCMAIALALVFGVAACSDDDDDSGGDTTAAETDSGGGGSGETVTIAASVPPTDHGWLGAVSKNAEEAAAEFDDVDFELVEAADADSQASQIETLINEKPDALVVLPHDGEALTPVAEKAMDAGIDVVNVDRLFSTPEAARATILGDNYGIGVQAGTYIANELDCEGNVVEIQGLAGISVTRDRTKGFEDTIKELCGDGIEVIAQQPGDFNPDTGLEVMEAILQAEDDIDAVYTHDDDMAEGVVAAIQNAGREDEMFLTGVGGSCNAFDAIEEGGLYRSTYLYNPTMAGSAVNMARLIALGQGFSDLTEPEVPSEIVVPPTEVTQDNVEDLRDYCFN